MLYKILILYTITQSLLHIIKENPQRNQRSIFFSGSLYLLSETAKKINDSEISDLEKNESAISFPDTVLFLVADRFFCASYSETVFYEQCLGHKLKSF